MKEKKVYCNACRYYCWPSYDEFHFTPDECWHPDNIKIKKEKVEATYRIAAYETSSKNTIKKPEEINKNNNCKWFKKGRLKK